MTLPNPSPTIYTLGELLVEIMRPEAGLPLHLPSEFQGPFPSGAPGIFISVAARLSPDNRTAIIGGVGRDKFGQNILERLRRDGVDCSQVNLSPKPTAVAFVAYEPDGEREFIYHIGGTAADDFRMDLTALTKPDAFHVMGCSLMASDIMRNAIQQAVEHYADCEISFDPNLRPELLQGRSFQDIAGNVMRHCSILLPGEAELLLAAGFEQDSGDANISRAIEQLFGRYTRLRVIHLKRGMLGSHIYTREGQIIEVPRYPIDRIMPIIDPTGAGDCFDAVFVASLLQGQALEKAGFLASKAGAINITVLGPMEGDISLLWQKLLPEDEPWL